MLMEPSSPSQPEIELNLPLPGVAGLLLVLSFLALLEPLVVLSHGPGVG